MGSLIHIPHKSTRCDSIRDTMDTLNPNPVGADVTLTAQGDNLELPNWLDPAPRKPSPEGKALAVVQFEILFPRIMDMIASGYDMTLAIEELPVKLNLGAFRRWVKKDPERAGQLKEAEELRSEVWADKMMRHAMGYYEMEDVNRSKLVVDSYKFRIAADNRKKYGASTSIEVTAGISVSGALAAAKARVIDFADVTDVEPK